MYVCGPTVYSHSHIGHGKSYVTFDIIVRYLRFIGYKVLYVQNITDVGHLLDSGEDRMLKQSKLEKVHPMQLAETFTRSYFEDMDALNILRPDISPRATGHIVEQIELVKRLLEKGCAYEVNGSVYFDVRSDKDYGKLSGRTLEETVEGTRVGTREEKRNPQDFALWKRAEPGHVMRWPSPWSEGFPGWHLECSAMSMKYLGESFDIHGGGLDNQFPHHECEIAQSECATGKPFVRYWIHNNLVTVNGQKMSKSLGNFVTLKDAFRTFDPLIVRFFILQSHYRSTLDFSDEALGGARSGWEKLAETSRRVKKELESAGQDRPAGKALEVGQYRRRFLDAMNDDFNTPQAIAVLFDFTRAVNQRLSANAKPGRGELEAIDAVFREYADQVLGILPAKTARLPLGDSGHDAPLMQILIDMRAEARKQKLFALSDMIRDRLKALGIVLEDTKDGTEWKLEKEKP